jgi:hypothetical protein
MRPERKLTLTLSPCTPCHMNKKLWSLCFSCPANVQQLAQGCQLRQIYQEHADQ